MERKELKINVPEGYEIDTEKSTFQKIIFKKKDGKDLLLKDLCARLPYGVKATTTSNGWNGTYAIIGCVGDKIYLDCPIYEDGDDEWTVELVKPYLRPMSSMTEEEWREYCGLCHSEEDCYSHVYYYNTMESIEWLNKRHFDYRGLIEKGLALKAPEGMYKAEELK